MFEKIFNYGNQHWFWPSLALIMVAGFFLELHSYPFWVCILIMFGQVLINIAFYSLKFILFPIYFIISVILEMIFGEKII